MSINTVLFCIKRVYGLTDDDQKELSDIHDVNTWRRGKPTISLYYTALHELGHTLGLDHSISAGDVMSPWYNPKQIKLSENDKRRLIKVAVYGKKSNGAQILTDMDDFIGNGTGSGISDFNFDNVVTNTMEPSNVTVNFERPDEVAPGPAFSNGINGNNDNIIVEQDGDDFTFSV